MVLSGQPINALKAVGAAGSNPGSSIVSYGADKALVWLSKQTGKNLSHFSKQVFTGFASKTGGEAGIRITASTSVGRVIGRWISIAGMGLIYYDFAKNIALPTGVANGAYHESNTRSGNWISNLPH